MLRQIIDSQSNKRSINSHLFTVFFFLFFLFTNVLTAQEAITTVIFVRHAEKGYDEAGDPDLTEEGIERAKLLADVLASQPIDKIYSTPFNRTRQTVEPIAEQKGLEVIEYNPFKVDDAIEIINNAGGQNLLFSGHSNTIPIMINKLLGNDDIRMIEDDEYDNIFILTLVNNQAKLLQLKY